MAVVTVHAPGLDDAIGISVLARATNVIDDPIGTAQFTFTHFLCNLG
jgi:hypothetical protein